MFEQIRVSNLARTPTNFSRKVITAQLFTHVINTLLLQVNDKVHSLHNDQLINRRCTSIQNNTSAEPKEHKAIAYWLLGMSGLVAGMVTVGGITRLTRSGLSMTDWTLSGGLPPTTTALWEIEFERYKQFPEWQQRKSMTLDEFKFIYAWEYGHRMMGRFLGVAFTVPLLYFSARGMVPRSLYPRLGLLFGLGGTQVRNVPTYVMKLLSTITLQELENN